MPCGWAFILDRRSFRCESSWTDRLPEQVSIVAASMLSDDMRSDQVFDLIELAAGIVMRPHLLIALFIAAALTVGAALGFLLEQASQPSEQSEELPDAAR
jgi:hypothetical protein